MPLLMPLRVSKSLPWPRTVIDSSSMRTLTSAIASVPLVIAFTWYTRRFILLGITFFSALNIASIGPLPSFLKPLFYQIF